MLHPGQIPVEIGEVASDRGDETGIDQAVDLGGHVQGGVLEDVGDLVERHRQPAVAVEDLEAGLGGGVEDLVQVLPHLGQQRPEPGGVTRGHPGVAAHDEVDGAVGTVRQPGVEVGMRAGPHHRPPLLGDQLPQTALGPLQL